MLEHKAFWEVKQKNMNLKEATDSRRLQLNELEEIKKNKAYDNAWIYKETTKVTHDKRISRKEYKVG